MKGAVHVSTVVTSCGGICVNNSALILICKYSRSRVAAVRLQSDAVLTFRAGQRRHYNTPPGAFSDSAVALKNENVFTQQIHSRPEQQGDVWQQKWNLPLNKDRYLL